MTKLEGLEKELKTHWMNTKEERERTHTKTLYEKSVVKKNLTTEKDKKRNIYHFLTAVLLICMIFVFIFMSLIIRDILNLAEDYTRGFIDFIERLLGKILGN